MCSPVGWPDVPHPSDSPQDTQQYTEQCPAGNNNEPPNDPRERCFNGVSLIFAACLQNGTNPITCQIDRVMALQRN